MADELKEVGIDAEKAGKAIGLTADQIKGLRRELEGMERSRQTTRGITGDFESISGAVGASKAKMSEFSNLFGGIGSIFLGNGKSADAFTGVMDGLGKTIGSVVGPGVGKFISELGKAPGVFDGLTAATRITKNSAMELGSAYGLSFDQIQPKFKDYQNALLLAQNYTYGGVDAAMQASRAAKEYGLSIDEITQSFNIAGTKQNIMSMGMLLATDTGLGVDKTFRLMGEAARTMGYSVENAGKPLIALENIATATGLPIDKVSDGIFSTVKRLALFGTTVDGVAPLVKRFTNILGDGFKGLAIEQVQGLVEGLGRQVNTTQAAFMAMQSGMAHPGAGVAGAMLDFEDAMAEPEKAMKMLAGSLGNISGGKILTIQDAHASEANATQFKLQRDMLTQLTGINDPQATKTLMAILADQQSGKQLSSQDSKTLEDAMKSGQQKQDEKATAKERIDKVTLGLQTQLNFMVGNLLDRMAPGQVQANIARDAGKVGAKGIDWVVAQAEALGSQIGGFMEKKGVNVSEYEKKYQGFLKSQQPDNNIQEGPSLNISRGPSLKLNDVELPAPVSPTPNFSQAPPSPSTAESSPATASKTAQAPGETGAASGGTFLIRGSTTLTRALADAMVFIHNKEIRGG